MQTVETKSTGKYYQYALILSLVTIFYNLAEGLASTYLGLEDDTLALFGFGADSFIEVISGVGIAHMVLRIRKHPDSSRDAFEIRALQITGVAFYLLVAGLSVSVAINLWTGKQPETTFWGVVISAVSILTMWLLIRAKVRVGTVLDSKPIIADANCTRACLYMSVVLLASSLLYELTHIAYLDAIGTIGIIYFCIKEGRECFQKAKGIKTCCDSDCC